MTLKEKYTIKNKKRIKQFVFLYSILVIFFMIYSSFAQYEERSEGYTKITVANWKMLINGRELKSNNSTLTDSITLIPTTNIDEEKPTKIKFGQEGYFDIEIDPTDTEVSFFYSVTLDLTNSVLPDGLSITSYSLDGGNTINALPSDKTLSNTVLLEGNDAFTEKDKQTIKYYWNWQGEDEGELDAAYTIIANVEIKQIL